MATKMTFDFSLFPTLGAVAALNNHSLLRVPQYLGDDTEEMLAAVPLAYWMADLVEPKTILSLDGTNGQLHGVFCEWAMSRKCDTDCYIHQAQPPAGRFMELCKKSWNEHSRPMPAWDKIAAGTADMITVEVNTTARVAEIDWGDLTTKLSSSGVILVYGAAADDIPREARYGTQGGCINLGNADVPLLLILGREAPAVLLSLIEQASGENDDEVSLAELCGLRAILGEQRRRLFLESWARRQSPLISDPTAPQFEPPKDLADAETQIAQLIEQQASDLEALVAGFAAKEEDRLTQERVNRERMHGLEADLARKDEIIATLEARIDHVTAVVAQQNVDEHSGVSRLFQRFLRR